MSVSDRDRSSDDQYRWLYGPSGGSDKDAGADAGRGDDDPDATRAIPPPGGGDPEATQAAPQPPQPAGQPADPKPGEQGFWAAPPGERADPPAPEPTRRVEQTPTDRDDSLPPPNLPPPGSRPPRRDDGAAPPRKPRRSRAKTVRRVLLGLFLVWLLFLVLVPIWAWSQIEKVDAEPDGERPGDQPGATYLVVGSDSREDLSAEEREAYSTGDPESELTDTIMLLHSGDGPTTLLSLPRDSPVAIPGEGTQKINAAYALGGPDLLVETVEQNTGIRVDGYVQIGIAGFVDVVDAVGGVEVCPDEAIADPKAGLDIDAGCQELEGADALGYARSRAFDSADLQRVQNQREVVGAIAGDAASPWTVLNPWRYFQLSDAGADSLTIGEDVGPIDLARFAWAMSEVSGGGKTCTVPLASGDATWAPEASAQMFRLISEDRTDEIGSDLCQADGLVQ